MSLNPQLYIRFVITGDFVLNCTGVITDNLRFTALQSIAIEFV